MLACYGSQYRPFCQFLGRRSLPERRKETLISREIELGRFAHLPAPTDLGPCADADRKWYSESVNYEKVPLDADELEDVDFPTGIVSVQRKQGPQGAPGASLLPGWSDTALAATVREGSKAATIVRKTSERLISKLS